MADDFPAETMAIVQWHIEDEHGYLSWLNIRVDVVECGHIVMTIPYDERLTNTVSPSTTHGGIAMTSVDTAGSTALRTMFDDPPTGGVVVINLSVDCPRRASGDLTVVAEVVRAGGSIGVSAITVVSAGSEEDSDAAAWQLSSSDWNNTAATGQDAYRLLRE